MLDLYPDKNPIRLDFQKSEKLLSDDSFNHNPEHARLFIVEDLSRDVIETFGAQYDIDPLFFRGHISDYLWYNTRDPWTELQDLSHISQEYVKFISALNTLNALIFLLTITFLQYVPFLSQPLGEITLIYGT